MSQLDLFTRHQVRAQVVTFPDERRVSLAHSIAARLDDVDYDSGKKLWQGVCRDIRKGLRNEGLSTAEVKASIDQLADAVHEELKSIRLQKQYRRPAKIFSMMGQRIEALPHGNGAGAAGALGQGTKFLAGLGGAHERTEYDAARAREGGAA
ncbi:hypothetical protein CN068_06905 [Sinorhizobium meliloti]|uniref:DUF6074 family protein n=1 Tax=Rhizobium meliloti TaxID=382 RepID=UPI000FDAFD55|nr:DUF6074 family protein [Sinorhizobium meliloti]RVH28174.1 hypothetical protein CN215_09945 [Sinorhizobium meliloti]RVQ41683.1 hypothetical protein CN068_06905 [Sinorhizobium meliloti]